VQARCKETASLDFFVEELRRIRLIVALPTPHSDFWLCNRECGGHRDRSGNLVTVLRGAKFKFRDARTRVGFGFLSVADLLECLETDTPAAAK